MVCAAGFEPATPRFQAENSTKLSYAQKDMEEVVRFELTDPFEPPVFEAGAFGHSAKLPKMVREAGLEPAGP